MSYLTAMEIVSSWNEFSHTTTPTWYWYVNSFLCDSITASRMPINQTTPSTLDNLLQRHLEYGRITLNYIQKEMVEDGNLKQTAQNTSLSFTQYSTVWWPLFCGVLFEGKSPLKECLNLDGLSRQETIGQHFPMNCPKIGHSYEAFTYLLGRNIFTRLFSANKNSPADLSE